MKKTILNILFVILAGIAFAQVTPKLPPKPLPTNASEKEMAEKAATEIQQAISDYNNKSYAPALEIFKK